MIEVSKPKPRHRVLRDDWQRDALRNIIVEILGGRCAWCEKTEKIELDHIIPLYSLGTNTLGNLQALCMWCHREKTRFDRFKFRKKDSLSKMDLWYIAHRKYMVGHGENPGDPPESKKRTDKVIKAAKRSIKRPLGWINPARMAPDTAKSATVNSERFGV